MFNLQVLNEQPYDSNENHNTNHRHKHAHAGAAPLGSLVQHCQSLLHPLFSDQTIKLMAKNGNQDLTKE